MFFGISLLAVRVWPFTTAFSLKSEVSHSCSVWPLVPCENSGMSRPVSAGFTIRSMVRSLPLKLRLASVSTLAVVPSNCTLTISDSELLFTSPFTSKLVMALR